MMIELEHYTVKDIIDFEISRIRSGREDEISYSLAKSLVLNALATCCVNRAIDTEVKEYMREILDIKI